jgi:hypothetical protein
MNTKKLNYKNLLISILILAAVGYIYKKYQLNVDNNTKIEELNVIKKYLLNDETDDAIIKLSANKKPVLWLHIDYAKNSRKWESFGSRNSIELNQDYLYLTLINIINKCNNYFHIIIIDDDSFCKLLENNCVDLNKVGDPIKSNLRTLNIMRLLHTYGGMYIENSFILFRPLNTIYDKVLETKKMVCGEFKNGSSNSHIAPVMPSTKLIGCVKECKIMKEFINHLEILYSNTYSGDITIQDLVNKWLLQKNKDAILDVIDGRFLGTKTISNKIIDLDELMGSTYLELNTKTYGLYIPHDELLKRNKYNWFCNLNTKEVLEANTNASKYLILTNQMRND